MPSASVLADAWMEFLAEIEKVRQSLRCSNSAAWFRGQCDHCWPLKPSLLRFGENEDPDDRAEIRRREQEIVKLKNEWQQRLREKKDRKKTTREAVEYRGVQYHAAEAASRAAKSDLAKARHALNRFLAPVNGERELFDEFVFRAGKAHDISSWEILAEMRHHGVPTRLLDWTDRLDIALYFALGDYRDAVPPKVSTEQAIKIVEKLPKPCIWVLNPFLLGKRATGRTAIWNLSREPDYDYYQRILRERTWPFDEPIPIYPPALFERLRSQRGYFTVLGNFKNPLEKQLAGGGNPCLTPVVMSPEAGVFCLDYLSRVQGLSPYEVYRDLDSLGWELTRRLQRIQRPASGE